MYLDRTESSRLTPSLPSVPSNQATEAARPNNIAGRKRGKKARMSVQLSDLGPKTISESSLRLLDIWVEERVGLDPRY